MHDERADHAHHFLHGHVRVIEVGAFLLQSELVDETAAGEDRVLREAGAAVHGEGDIEAVPVHGGRLGEMIVHDDADAVALNDLDGGAGGGAVVAPEIEDLAGEDFLFYWFGDQVKDFDAIV